MTQYDANGNPLASNTYNYTVVCSPNIVAQSENYNRELVIDGLVSILGLSYDGLPSIQIENIISGEIEHYRRILTAANDLGDSGIFITYMLGLVLSSLKVVRIERTKAGNFDPLNDLINLIENDPKSTYVELAAKLSVSPATIKRRIAELKKTGVIKRVGSKKTGNWQIIRSDQ